MPIRWRKMFLVGGVAIAAGMGWSEAREKTLSLRSGGRVTGFVNETARDVRIAWPFGSMVIPKNELTKSPAPENQKTVTLSPTALGYTTGDFVLRYVLEERDGVIFSKALSVIVRNTVRLSNPGNDPLAYHENIHSRINESVARSAEGRLGTFRFPVTGKTADFKKAEQNLRAMFRREIRLAETLHADWDANHTVP